MHKKIKLNQIHIDLNDQLRYGTDVKKVKNKANIIIESKLTNLRQIL
jgi:uncharacterized alkaline shock family protein YloU